ncbi:MAG: RimK/LysX family protein [Cyclobacteriaceae bacterium]
MIVIGRRDKIDLPELELFNIEAKVDTGAYGCALHCHETEEVLLKGQRVLSFKVLDPEHPEFADKNFYASNYNYKSVKNSSGESEDRYAIETDIVVFGKKRTVEFSLTDRSEMKYPILLGRKFLSKHYLVDVQQKDLSFTLKTEKK